MARDALRLAIVYFLPLALLSTGIVYLLFQTQQKSEYDLTAQGEVRRVESGRLQVIGDIDGVVSDVRYLAREESLQRWLDSGMDEDLRHFELDLLAFSRTKGIYDQIRFIDSNGLERARVNWGGGDPFVVQSGDLQDKSQREYFPAALGLEGNQVFVSRLDLNVEQGRIETPIKPTMRVAAPVFGETGETRGIVVLNYLGQRLLERLANLDADGTTRQSSLWLLNAEGYWMLGPSEADEWAFMYPGREDRSFSHRYPQAWQVLNGAPANGQFEVAGDLLTHARILPLSPEALGAGPADGVSDQPAFPTWYLVSHFPASARQAQRQAIASEYLVPWLGLLAILAAISIATARIRVRQRQAEKQQRESDAQFRTLMESAPDAILVTDSEGTIRLVNRQTEAMFGYDRDALLGQPVEILVPEARRDIHREERSYFVSNPKTRSMGAGRELTGLRRDGSEFPIGVGLSPVVTEQGMLIYCAVRDITELRAAEALRASNRRLVLDNHELEAVNEELAAFSYSVSHDLRAPLRTIDGFGRALEEDCADRLGEDGRSHLDRVLRATHRMSDLIDALLTLSGVTRTSLVIEEIDLTAMAHEIVQELRADEPERDVEVSIHENLRTYGDRRLIRVALENLLENSWKFTGKRQEARIEFGRKGANGEAVFFVRDNGTGFDMTYASKLFGAFQRMHGPQEFPGTGIGLATVQRVINKHGGRVWAEASPDVGASFFFSIDQEVVN